MKARYSAAAIAILAMATVGAHAQTPIRTRAPVTGIVKTLIAAPTGVTVSGNLQGVTIAWAAAAGATSYRVLKSADPTQPGADITQPVTTTTVVDLKPVAGQTFYYTVVSVSSTGLTAASAPVGYAAPAVLAGIDRSGYSRVAPPPPPAPAPVIPAGTSVVPALSLPGRTVQIRGQGMSAVTGVTSGTTSLTWSPVSDTEISVVLPAATPGLFGTQPVPISLLHAAPNVAPGTVVPAPTVLYPPKILSLSNHWAECCELIAIRGFGFSGSPAAVTVGGVSAVVVNGTDGLLLFRIPLLPANDPGGPKVVTVQHAGGSATATAPLTLVTGPSSITSITPDVIPLRTPTTVTIQGTNLFRLVGICVPGTTQVMPRNDLASNLNHMTALSSNDQMTVMVNHKGGTGVMGPISMAMPATVPTGSRSFNIGSAVCQPNPTAVNVTIQ